MFDAGFSRLGKGIESLARRLRPYVLPRYRKSFANLLARGMREHEEGQRVVCCDFANPAIDAVGGRYCFSLVRDFVDAGYFVVFTARRATLSSLGTSSMKSLLLTERFGVVNSLKELRQPYDLITDSENPPPVVAWRVVVVNYEWRRCENAGEVALPLFVHPQVAAQAASGYDYDLTAVRPARIFFGGNTQEGKYDKNIIHDVYGMLTRREMLAVTRSIHPEATIHRPLDASVWLASPQPHPFVLCETQHCKIPQERWLDALAKADFFLACPGVGMPLCHNLIEAMAVGAIPILQYAHYLTPELREGINCLTFRDEQTLRHVIVRASVMSQKEVATMRENVRGHYQKYLAPGCFAKRLFEAQQPRLTLRLNAYRVTRQSPHVGIQADCQDLQ